MALNENAQYAYRYYIDKWKLKPHQAAGIVGNLMQESSLNTGARNPGDGRDGSDSIGVAQWNGGRARGLHQFAKERGTEVSDLDTQLDYVMHELQGPERSAYERLMAAKDVAGATQAIIGFERPAGWSADNPTGGHGYGNRLKYAGSILGMSPEQLAQATGTSGRLETGSSPTIAATGSAGAGTGADASGSVRVGKPENEGLLAKLGINVPDKILGIETNKGLGAMSGFAELITKQADNMNQQMQQTAQAAQARRANTGPIQVQEHKPTPMGGISGPLMAGAMGTANTQIDEELLKKLMLARRGGLGGLGGIGRA